MNFQTSQQATTRLNDSTLSMKNDSASSSLNITPDAGATTNFSNDITFSGSGAGFYNITIPNSGVRGATIELSGNLSGAMENQQLFFTQATADLSGTGQWGVFRLSGDNSGLTSTRTSGAIISRFGYLFLDSANALGANNSLSVQIGAYNSSNRLASGLLASAGNDVTGDISVTIKSGVTGEAFLGLDGTGSVLYSGNISLNNASSGSFVNNLHLRALPGGTVTFSGNIKDSGVSSATNDPVIVDGGGTVVLTGSDSTFWGNTIVNAGTLRLDFASSTTPTNILNASANRSTLVLGGGTLDLLGKASTTNSQRFNDTSFNTGASAISLSANATSNSLSLSLGALTRNAGSTVDFVLPTGVQSGSNGITTTSTTFVSNGVLVSAAANGVAYATVGGSDWASLSGSNIEALSSYNTNSFTSTDNTDVTGDQTPGSGITVNTLRFNDTAASSVTLSGTNTISTGGVLVTANTATNGAAIAGGSVNAGSSNELVVINNGKLAVSSALTDGAGATGLTIAGPGVTTLSGANTYTGQTIINEGTVSVSNIVVAGGSSNLGNAASAVVLGDGGHKGTLSYTGSSATYTRGFVIGTGGGEIDVATSGQTLTIGTGSVTYQSSTGTYGDLTIGGAGNTTITSLLDLGFGGLTKNGAGLLTLSGANSYSGVTTINEGTLALGIATGLPTASPIVINGATLNLGGFTTATMQGSATLNGGVITNGTLALGNNTLYATSGTVSASITGGGVSLYGSLVKTGAGTLTLTANNGYSGASYLNGGVLQISAANNLGNSGGNNSIHFDGGTLESTANTYSLGTNRAIALDGAGTIQVDAGTLTVNGVVSGTGTFTKSGSGTAVLSAANSFTGDTVISSGTLTMGHTQALQGSTLNYNNQGGALSFGSLTSASAGGLKGGQNLALTNASSAAVALSLGANGQNTTYSGTLSGAGSLTKVGAGTLTLTGGNTFTGATVVSVGTLIVNGSLAAGSAVTVGSGGALAGSGTINGSVLVQSGATLSPGNSPGQLTQGATTLSGGGNYNWQIVDATGGAGTAFDTISLTTGHALTLNNTSLTPFNINLWSLSSIGPDVNGDATNFVNTSTYSWTLISTDQTIVGFSADKFVINMGAINGTSGFTNDLAGGAFSVATSLDGTDLLLNYTAVPEPTTWVLVAGAGALFAAMRRKRQM